MLRERPRLITDGFFKRSRNTNYLGELFIYSSYAIFSAHWLSFVVLAFWVTNFFFRMKKKDKSLSRYPEFEAYKRATGLIFPRLWSAKEPVAERNEIAPVR
jgi:protein-S-isoprenylcysteine O-methyltransferase Ste14